MRGIDGFQCEIGDTCNVAKLPVLVGTSVTVLIYLMSGDWRRGGLNCPSVLLIITNDLLGTSVTRVGR